MHICASSCKYVVSLDMAQFNAGFIGLRFAHEVGFYDVILEGYRLTVITTLSNRHIELDNTSVIVADMLDLSNLYNSCSLFFFIKQYDNYIAQALVS